LSEPMTDERIARIRKRADAASLGPWQVVHDATEVSVESEPLGRFVCHLNDNMTAYWADAELIAHARQDIPDLLDELERIQGHEQATMDGCLATLTRARDALYGVLAALGLGYGASELLDELDEAVRQLGAGKP
jgi:hypothetical protein